MRANALVSLSLLSASFVAASNTSLPVVDLGYELHRAYHYNESTGFYNFTNVRYAQAPVGDLRFAAPVAPKVNRSVIQDGADGKFCIQSRTKWLLSAEAFAGEYIADENLTSYHVNTTGTTFTHTHGDLEDEDCLLLDIVVPKTIFDKRGNSSGAPVMVWTYGGGYVMGSKESYGDPSGLMARSQRDGSDGVIYVSFGYRLGIYGFLSGPTFQQDGTANAGFHDQRMALNWVQDNIHLFGGDKDRVTVFGESAGAGSIIHQITAYGGHKEKAPFQRAVIQSPAWGPVPSSLKQEDIYQQFLSLLGVSSLSEARQASAEALLNVNDWMVGNATYGQDTVGPAIDGDFVPANPASLLQHGEFDKNVSVMIGYNGDEAVALTPYNITDTADLYSFLESFLPYGPTSSLEYIVNTLYPEPGNTTSYTTQTQRAILCASEFAIVCNAVAVDLGFNNETYAYLFDVWPAIHGQDVPYTYYNPQTPDFGEISSSVPTNETIAFAMQDYFTSFAMHGKPTTVIDGLPTFEKYGPNGIVHKFTGTGVSNVVDPALNKRCEWWNLGLLS